MSVDYAQLVKTGIALTDAALERLLPGTATQPHNIHRAMRHSVFAGGKRLRPLLVIESARMIAGDLPDGAADVGAAIEMLHTYSLIHDDLPALDNDDLRRGKPTCHVVYGEAMAILAGDALQTLAYETLAKLSGDAAAKIEIVKEVAIATGTGVGSEGLAPGMIGGQVMDIEGEGQKPTAELVEAIHRSKTGALITVSIVAGGLIGGASADEVMHLRRFGQRAGLAFQIVDDILDVTQSSAELGKTAGKDTASDKATWPAVFGLDASRETAAELLRDGLAELAGFGARADALKAVAKALVERTN
ncbi:geranylgeranyl pyrophosphate synthase [Terriglobus roseus DSM 18391]|uniref:Geranylgeranyl pyrophosphate synthase n=1 Tax=Terriglobus roseus (strain DSM 18391 / NRRL B-41598 / KBS 63) TaxID=926566 RepID=I3ZKI4_TERRK|nr:farnesyl diphosphate synthase [Terriglobus roseus]AFL89752.1 geranylgeranyl pyrophosphate synthase [Terriglobus roseus DSM 18391]